jgi:hypothetical protein
VYSYNSVARTLTNVTILAFTTSSATIFSVIQCLPSYNSMIPGSHEGGSHCLWFSCRRRGHAVARAPTPPPPGGHGSNPPTHGLLIRELLGDYKEIFDTLYQRTEDALKLLQVPPKLNGRQCHWLIMSRVWFPNRSRQILPGGRRQTRVPQTSVCSAAQSLFPAWCWAEKTSSVDGGQVHETYLQ